MRRRIGALRQPEKGKKRMMVELEAGWAAVAGVIILKMDMKKE